jgi:hypothetical protein
MERPPRYRRVLRGGALCVVLAMGLDAGCADRCANDATYNHKQRKLATHVYDKPLPQVYAQLRQLVSEHGYTLPRAYDPRAVKNRTLMTPWKADRRWLVRVNMLDGTRFQVRLSEQYKDEQGQIHHNRSLPLVEWTLFERVEPAQAQQVRAAATRSGEQAAASCHGCAGCAGLMFGC